MEVQSPGRVMDNCNAIKTNIDANTNAVASILRCSKWDRQLFSPIVEVHV